MENSIDNEFIDHILDMIVDMSKEDALLFKKRSGFDEIDISYGDVFSIHKICPGLRKIVNIHFL